MTVTKKLPPAPRNLQTPHSHRKAWNRARQQADRSRARKQADPQQAHRKPRSKQHYRPGFYPRARQLSAWARGADRAWRARQQGRATPPPPSQCGRPRRDPDGDHAEDASDPERPPTHPRTPTPPPKATDGPPRDRTSTEKKRTDLGPGRKHRLPCSWVVTLFVRVMIKSPGRVLARPGDASPWYRKETREAREKYGDSTDSHHTNPTHSRLAPTNSRPTQWGRIEPRPSNANQVELPPATNLEPRHSKRGANATGPLACARGSGPLAGARGSKPCAGAGAWSCDLESRATARGA